ncbi:MAG TPA: hypothetical protein DCM08_09060, partial [Microscillaceae bacterium]|nr:hypothetical protein [Microscillaceae bacterium]
MKHLTTFALFCNFIAIIGACLYLIFRTGFDTPTEPIFLVLGLSSLLLNFSNHFYSLWLRLRPALQQTTPPWYLSDNALNLGIFLFITALGYVEAQFLAYPLALMGYVLLLNNLRLFLSSQPIARSLGGGLLALFFSLWVANTVWGKFCNEPTLVETALFFSKEMFFPTLIDTFYHITAAQIHKTYQTVSTGLDGLPFMYYHTYSHWTMGQFSKLTGVSVLEIYSMGYVVLIAPFFFRVFLSFVAEVRLFFLQPSSGHISLNFYFWLTFLALFIQFPRHLYSGGLLGLPFIIVESYTFSLFFLVGWFSLLMAFWKTPAQSGFTKGLFLWFVLPFLYFCICYSSISTGFVLAGLIAYLFFRLRLFRKGAYVVATGLLAAVFVGTYLLAVETNIFGRSYHQEGELAFFYFFFHTHPFEAFNFWGLFYGWLYAAIITYFYVVKKGSRNPLPINPALPGYLGAEIVLVIAFFGLLPCFFVKMLGGTAMYFLGIQLWVSGGLLMALLPNVQIALPTA